MFGKKEGGLFARPTDSKEIRAFEAALNKGPVHRNLKLGVAAEAFEALDAKKIPELDLRHMHSDLQTLVERYNAPVSIDAAGFQIKLRPETPVDDDSLVHAYNAAFDDQQRRSKEFIEAYLDVVRQLGYAAVQAPSNDDVMRTGKQNDLLSAYPGLKTIVSALARLLEKPDVILKMDFNNATLNVTVGASYQDLVSQLKD